MTLKKIWSIGLKISNTHSPRSFSVTHKSFEKIAISKSETRVSWDRAVDDAIKCVGYQTPYLSLSYLTNCEDVNWFKNMEKLETTNHPMRDTAR